MHMKLLGDHSLQNILVYDKILKLIFPEPTTGDLM